MSRSTLSLGFLVFPGFPMACLTSLIEPLRAANEISQTEEFSWTVVSEHGGKTRSSAQVDFDSTCLHEAGTNLDYLFILAPPAADFERPSTAGTLRSMARHGTRMGAVSGGVFPLVRAELGLGQPLAVHWCYRAAFDTAFPNHMASDQVVEIGETILTAAGAAAAFDIALHIVESRVNATVAAEVACWFQHPMMRKANVAQVVPLQDATTTLPPLVARAVDLLKQDLTHPQGVAQIAHQVGVSPRQLERAFKKATALSPSRYYRKMRMEAARQIVMYTNDPVSKIASAVGYCGTQAFSKHYHAAFGLSPAEDRKRINLYRVEGNLPVPSV